MVDEVTRSTVETPTTQTTQPTQPTSRRGQAQSTTQSTQTTDKSLEEQQKLEDEIKEKQQLEQEKVKNPEYGVSLTAAELTQKHFNYVMSQVEAAVGERPHVYHLCHNHRAAVINHVGEVNSDNAALVDTHQCLLCQYPIA